LGVQLAMCKNTAQSMTLFISDDISNKKPIWGNSGKKSFFEMYTQSRHCMYICMRILQLYMFAVHSTLVIIIFNMTINSVYTKQCKVWHISLTPKTYHSKKYITVKVTYRTKIYLFWQFM